ncbi:MAG: 50S ribosomal protein L32 [Candidatus Falkowbacteria bacterium]
MANPKKRRTKSAVGKNRSHLALKPVTLNVCPKCGKAVKPHTACSFCGSYKGRVVVAIKVKKATPAKKKA